LLVKQLQALLDLTAALQELLNQETPDLEALDAALTAREQCLASLHGLPVEAAATDLQVLTLIQEIQALSAEVLQQMAASQQQVLVGQSQLHTTRSAFLAYQPSEHSEAYFIEEQT